MKKILITQFVVGPTYKDRIIYNIKKYADSYKYFHTIIVTDDVEYFKDIDNPNIAFADVEELRQWHPWSKDFEILPIERKDETAYAKEFIYTAAKIPTLMRRFVLGMPGVESYCGYIFMDADVVPIATDETYAVLEDFFCNATTHPEYGGDLSDKMCVIPGIEMGYSGDDFLYEYAVQINKKYNVAAEVKKNFILTDGNFRCIKFGNKAQIHEFYQLLNNVILDIYRGDYSVLRAGIIWNLHSEHILAIIFNLMGAVGYPMTVGSGIHPQSCFRIDSYPEDRFWHSGLGFKITDTKEDFIRENYDKLKEFYENRGQVWEY